MMSKSLRGSHGQSRRDLRAVNVALMAKVEVFGIDQTRVAIGRHVSPRFYSTIPARDPG